MAKKKSIPDGDIKVPVIDRRTRFIPSISSAEMVQSAGKRKLDETEKEQMENARIMNLQKRGTPTPELKKQQDENTKMTPEEYFKKYGKKKPTK